MKQEQINKEQIEYLKKVFGFFMAQYPNANELEIDRAEYLFLECKRLLECRK